MSTQNFTHPFTTSRFPEEVFNTLINPKNWWIGFHNEIISGKSENINDAFIFDAGNGVHHSVQKLIEINPDKKIAWEVIDSSLTFLKNSKEWTGTKITFEILNENNMTKVTFIHDGLVPEFECFGGCSSAWKQYLEKLEKNLNQ